MHCVFLPGTLTLRSDRRPCCCGSSRRRSYDRSRCAGGWGASPGRYADQTFRTIRRYMGQQESKPCRAVSVIRPLTRSQYDWDIQTVPQKYADGRACEWSLGKCLGMSTAFSPRLGLTGGIGGSSAMNFCVWTKPHAQDVDAWEKLGNPGWDWNSFQKYSLRAEQSVRSRGFQLRADHFQYRAQVYRCYTGSACKF